MAVQKGLDQGRPVLVKALEIAGKPTVPEFKGVFKFYDDDMHTCYVEKDNGEVRCVWTNRIRFLNKRNEGKG